MRQSKNVANDHFVLVNSEVVITEEDRTLNAGADCDGVL